MARLSTSIPASNDAGATVAVPTTALAAATSASALLAACVVAAAGWPRFDLAALDAVVSGSVVSAACVIGAAVLWAMGPRPLGTAAQGFIAASLVRTGVSLSAALALALLREPEALPYWIGFLAAAAAALVVETVMAARVLRGASAATSARSTPGKAPGTEQHA